MCVFLWLYGLYFLHVVLSFFPCLSFCPSFLIFCSVLSHQYVLLSPVSHVPLSFIRLSIPLSSPSTSSHVTIHPLHLTGLGWQRPTCGRQWHWWRRVEGQQQSSQRSGRPSWTTSHTPVASLPSMRRPSIFTSRYGQVDVDRQSVTGTSTSGSRYFPFF